MSARDAETKASAIARKFVTGDNVRHWVIVLLTALLLPTQMLGASAQTESATTRDSDVGPVIASLPAADAARGVSLKGLATAREGACVGMLEIVDVDGPGQSCTHGPDAAPVSIGDVRTADMTPQEAAAVAESSPPFVCDGDGISGRRVQAIYAVTPDRADRFAQYEAAFKGIIAGVQDQVRDSSAAHGSDESLLFRFAHTTPVGGACEPVVDHVKLTSNAHDDSFGATIDALRAKGYLDPSRRYLVFVDANILCGIGQMALDDRPSPSQNWNNVLYEPMFSRVDAGCWDYAETHELAHNIGAVQDSAPHASGFGHCNDDYDLMCYADGGPTSSMFINPACPSSTWERLLDCGGDDYFNPSPAPGSYLATHWNIASSGWLFVESDPPASSDPTAGPDTSITSGPTGTVESGDAVFKFSSNRDATFECRLDDGAWDSCTSRKSYAGLRVGNHTFRVRATDAVGRTDASPASRSWSVAAVARKAPVGTCTDVGQCYFLSNSLQSGTADEVFGYGRADDQVLVGDWDGDAADTLAVRRGATYYLSNDFNGGAADSVFDYGRGNDEVFVGDWDGDGKDTLAVRRGTTFYVMNRLGGGNAESVFEYGRPGDVVLVGDWDGDGDDSFAVRRGRTYYISNELRGGQADAEFVYGRAGDRVYVGDWDANSTDTLGVRRGRTYYLSNALQGGKAASEFVYGRNADVTLIGDWNADGGDTLGIRR
ncbi:MAG: hypothetical protein ACJA2F_000541 [Nitriliruptoraceae bacterium]